MADTSRRTRPDQPMPADIAEALDEHGLREAYDARPAYQRNDYLGWIGKAKQDDTRRKRLDQMLDELREGGVYMGMAHAPSRIARENG
ncbi:YdeI/OmpD-associated family protein [Luteipulveratus halotolerans]|uniref:Bacteriocin-protection, YdeI or OmpD-Associated n=1 Tax=Luteipulveratus halotolerans TaxID=1631356 RepID=A0A0L6CMC5_9MICO|nr:YdeI/OmpD-associated family protein [Luteipulveratus halotolerans]KNX38884.1 hypothetical protein VV01_19915 [Luteipulveratus halotolerans]